MLNLTPDSDLGRKTVPETCVRFDATFAKVVAIMTQILTKYEQFLEQYPSRPFHPICRFHNIHDFIWKGIQPRVVDNGQSAGGQ